MVSDVEDESDEGDDEEGKLKQLVQVFTLGPLQAYRLAALYVQWHLGGTTVSAPLKNLVHGSDLCSAVDENALYI